MYLFRDYNGRVAAIILCMLHRGAKSWLPWAPDYSFAQIPLGSPDAETLLYLTR